LRRWSIGLLVVVVAVVAGFQAYFQVEYGTLAWWSAPHRISYCGMTYIPVTGHDPRVGVLGAPVRTGNGSVANRAALGELVEATSVPPLFRPVFSAPDAFPHAVGDTSQECPDPLFYQSGSGQLIEYANGDT
jgi:hypothetical protein